MRCGVFALIRPQVSQFVLLTQRMLPEALLARSAGRGRVCRNAAAHFKESQPLSLQDAAAAKGEDRFMP